MSSEVRTEYRPRFSPEVLLVLPPLYQTGREPDYNPKEPMGLMSLAASLRQDERRALPSLELVTNDLRRRGYSGHITCGGITPTLSFPYILERLGDKIDSVVLGEGENILRDLANRVLTRQDWRDIPGIAYRDGTNQVVRKPMDMIDLDALPFAARDYLDYCLGKTRYVTIMGSRGCYGICTFCSNYSFEAVRSGPRWRSRSPAEMVGIMLPKCAKK